MSGLKKDFIKCALIEDFMKCAKDRDCGFFKGDRIAAEYANSLTASQRKKWKLFGQVPAAFLHYLMATKAISRRFVPEKERTIWKVLDLLQYTPMRNGKEPSVGEKIRKALLIEFLGSDAKRLMASSEFTWLHAQVFGVKRR